MCLQEQKRLEFELSQQLKKPIDDLCLKDLKPLPDLNRIPGVRLAGEAYANCLMVVEFCLNFKDALKFGMSSSLQENCEYLKKIVNFNLC